MLPRSGPRQVLRLSQASSSRLPVRNLSSGLTRPSSVALGKRPARSALQSSSSFASVRYFSINPFKSTSPDTPPQPQSTTPYTSHEPILTTPHPDLQSAPSSSSAEPALPPAPTSSAPTAATSTTSSPPSTTPTPSVLDQVPSAPNDLATSSADAITQASTKLYVPGDATLTDIITQNPNVPLQAILESPEAISAVCKVSDLQNIGLKHSILNPAGWFSDGLVALQNLTGLPWWATIGLMTVFIRASLIRPLITAQQHNARLQAIAPQQAAIMQRTQQAKKEGKQDEIILASQTLQRLWSKNDVHPLRALKLPLLQMPVVLSMFYALRRLSELPLPGMKDGGLSWFSDLTVSDPYYVLPISSLILTNIVVRVGADGTGAPSTQVGFARHMPNIIMVMSILGFFLIQRFPAAVLFYWTTTNSISVLQALLLKQATVKRILGLKTPPPPPPPPEGTKTGRATLGESWEWASGSVKGIYTSSRQRQMDAIAAAEKRATKHGLSKTGIAAETIREKPVSTGTTKSAANSRRR